VYNVLPHASIKNQIPYTLQHGRQPDVSWIRPFGCKCVTYRGNDVVEHHKLAPRGEKCIHVGLGLLHGRKAWLTFSPRVNRVFATTQVTFDETFFPARPHDQRIFGYYDTELRNELRADLVAHQFNTDTQWTSAALPDPIWTPSDIQYSNVTSRLEEPDGEAACSQAETVPAEPHTRGAAGDVTARGAAGDVTARGAAGEITAPGAAGDPTSIAAGTSPSTVADADFLSAGDSVRDDHFPNVRYDSKGRRQLLPDKMSEYGVEQQHWKGCADNNITATSDLALAEYIVGHALELQLNNDYWPRDKGAWTVSCGDVVIANQEHKDFANGTVLIHAVFLSGPQQENIGKFIYIAMSGPYSIRRAINENKPTAVLCRQILEPSLIHTRSRTRGVVKNVTDAIEKVAEFIPGVKTRSRLKIDHSKGKQHAFVAFTAIQQVVMLAAAQPGTFSPAFEDPEPKSQRAARKRIDWKDWIQAEQAEYEKVTDMGTLKFVANHSIPPGTTCIPTKYAYKCKFDEHGQVIKKNARLVVRGDLQKESEFSETFAPTSRFNSLRCVFASAAQNDYKLYQFDVKGAFMVSPIEDQDIYIQLPPGYEAPPGTTAMLSQSLYGLRDAAYRFHKTLSDWMPEYGCEALDADRTMFRYDGEHGTMTINLYVDDGLVSTDSEEEYRKFITALQQRFELSADDSEVKWYLGVQVTRDLAEGYVHLNQEQYINNLLERFQMQDTKPVLTPMEVGVRLTSFDQPDWSNKNQTKDDVDTIRAYQQIVGSLMYTLAWCHPEIAFGVQQCSRYMANPGPSHIKAARRILSYLKGVKSRGITYRRSATEPANQLHAYADADHAGDIEGRCSVTGYVLILNGSAVSWQSVKQDVVALSSAESEYYAASAAGCDIIAIRRVLEGMGHEQVGPTPLGEDNVACIHMSKSSAMYHKAKHIDVRVYKLREFVREKVMQCYYIPTADQVADALTKSIPSPAFIQHTRVMAGYPPAKKDLSSQMASLQMG